MVECEGTTPLAQVARQRIASARMKEAWAFFLRPLVLLGLLALLVKWAVAGDFERLLWFAFSWPIAVAIFLVFRIDRVFAHQRELAGFEFTLQLHAPTNHPLMKDAYERFEKRRRELSEDELHRLWSTSQVGSAQTYLIHNGLIWSYREKSYVRRIQTSGRWFGDLLVANESPDQQEPSIIVFEHHGRLKVALVPVTPQRFAPLGDDRNACEARDYAILTGFSVRGPKEAEPTVLMDFPLGELVMLECAAERSILSREYRERHEKLLSRSGFERVTYDVETARLSDASEIRGEHATIWFRRVSKPFWASS